jgi:hypothetical protein
MSIPPRVIVFVVAARALFTLHTPAFSLSSDIERRVETLLRQMTLDGKTGHNQASAVLLLCNFVQLETQVNADLQVFVKDMSAKATNPLLIFINRFDRQSTNDWEGPEVHEHLPQTLLDRIITTEQIYPTLALHVFLSNWAQRNFTLKIDHPASYRSGAALSIDRNSQPVGLTVEGFGLARETVEPWRT